MRPAGVELAASGPQGRTMPVSIPGFVFDPVTNRYYKEAPRSQESSSANTVMRRIAVQRFEARNAQRRKNAAKKRPREGGQGGTPGDRPSTLNDRRLHPHHGNYGTLGRLLAHRECGRLPCSRMVQRLSLENDRGMRAEKQIVHGRWLGPSPAISISTVLGTTRISPFGPFVWSRGATNKLLNDDYLILTSLAAVKPGERMNVFHLNYPTKSPVIHVSDLGDRSYAFGLMGSGLEAGRVVVHRPAKPQDLINQRIFAKDGRLTDAAGEAGRAVERSNGTTVEYSAGGTLWSVSSLADDCLSIGERESARVLRVGESSIQSLWRARYRSDVLAQGCIRDRNLVLHGLRNGCVHLADWRVEEQRGSNGGGVLKCKAGRSVVEVCGNPRDPHQFAVLSYQQLPRLWDVRMCRPLAKYAAPHPACSPVPLDGLVDSIDTLKLSATSGLRISPDGSLVGCVASYKSIAGEGSQLDLLKLWSVKTGKALRVTGERTLADFDFLQDDLCAKMSMPQGNTLLALGAGRESRQNRLDILRLCPN